MSRSLLFLPCCLALAACAPLLRGTVDTRREPGFDAARAMPLRVAAADAASQSAPLLEAVRAALLQRGFRDVRVDVATSGTDPRQPSLLVKAEKSVQLIGEMTQVGHDTYAFETVDCSDDDARPECRIRDRDWEARFGKRYLRSSDFVLHLEWSAAGIVPWRAQVRGHAADAATACADDAAYGAMAEAALRRLQRVAPREFHRRLDADACAQ